MGFINVAERTINAKLVYYGVGVGGKTTSLQQVHGIFCPRNEVQLVSISTEEDSTLMFDFLPINLGNVGGFKIRIQGYTVPGQPKYRQMRKLVLQGADAVVLVVDSQRSRLEENCESLRSMRESLRGNSGTSEDIPIVVQYNKRDLDDILSESELDRRFLFRDDIQAFPTVATEGQGVFEAFVQAAGLLIESKVELYGLGDDSLAKEVAAEARQRLWDVCDEARRSRSVVSIEELPQTRLAVADDVAAEDDDWQSPTLLDELKPGPRSAEVPESDESDEDFQLDYELRDTSGSSVVVSTSDEVLSEEELDIDFSAGEVSIDAAKPDLGIDDAMLDKSVRANLKLAERYGELDEQKLRYERQVHEVVDGAQRAVHDLRKPLSALGMMLKLVDKGTLGDLPPRVQDAVANGLEAVGVMSRLVEDLLDSSQLDHDGVELDFCECSLEEIVGHVVATLRFELEAKDVEVKVVGLPRIKADPWGLTKVFLNLIGNAVAYTAPGRAPVLTVKCVEDGSDWVVSVSDNGIGIPEQDRDRLFRRFERGSNTGGISGTGLGLHIVREIVQGHGGTVTFESEVGRGTTFHLRLPKQPKLAAHSPISQQLSL